MQIYFLQPVKNNVNRLPRTLSEKITNILLVLPVNSRVLILQYSNTRSKLFQNFPVSRWASPPSGGPGSRAPLVKILRGRQELHVITFVRNSEFGKTKELFNFLWRRCFSEKSVAKTARAL